MTFRRTEKREKHFKCSGKLFLLMSFVQSLNLPFPLMGRKEGKKEGKKGGGGEEDTTKQWKERKRSAEG